MHQVVGVGQTGHSGWRQADINGDAGVVQCGVDHRTEVADGCFVRFNPTIGMERWWPVDVQQDGDQEGSVSSGLPGGNQREVDHGGGQAV